jgi:chromosome segregation ATPase
VQQEEYKTMIGELEEHVRALEAELQGARRAISSKEGIIDAVEHEAGAARSQLMQTESVLERKNEDVVQLTSQLQVCILELKALSEKSREAQSRQRNVFETARVNSSLNNRFLPHHELESRPVPAAVADT